jgi:hypothetical protein
VVKKTMNETLNILLSGAIGEYEEYLNDLCHYLDQVIQCGYVPHVFIFLVIYTNRVRQPNKGKGEVPKIFSFEEIK